MNSGIQLLIQKPAAALSPFVESFWLLTNYSDEAKPVIILPDGRIDLSYNPAFGLTLLGLETGPSQAVIPPRFTMFTVSFRPLALEYLFKEYTPLRPDQGQPLPGNYLGFTPSPQQDFETVCAAFQKILLLRLNVETDPRKQNLFDLIYASNGAISIAELSAKVFWSSRQINRYCQDMFGMPLKTYCSILRFRASFNQIKEGKLFPEEHFADQSHFIREIRKFSGVKPKDLARNQNDRFIQFSTLPKQ